MSAIKKYNYPYRMPMRRLEKAYPSLGEAFAAGDYLWVARFGKMSPELHGCALLMLGNRVGGERILNLNNIHNARSCLYRAYSAWQYSDMNEARRWISEGRSINAGDIRFEKLLTLVNRKNFRIVFHCDFDGHKAAKTFYDLPGFDVVVTRQLQEEGPGTLPIGKPLASIVPAGPPIDFVLLDDLKMVPVGIGDLGAPVIANCHDHEWYYDLLEDVMPEIDLVSSGATQDLLEVARAYNCPGALYFYHFPLKMPDMGRSISENYQNTPQRTIDLFYSTWEIGYDFYRYKREGVLSLADIDKQFNVKIVSGNFPFEIYWQHLKSARFSMVSTRFTNYSSTRMIEAINCGTLHLVEEEAGYPHAFSEHFDCFPTYRREHMAADVEKHLHNYNGILDKFRPQLPQLEAEMKSLFPADDKTRALAYLRHLLFITQVERNSHKEHNERPRSTRKTVFTNEYDYLLPYPAQLKRFIEQTPAPHYLRRGFGKGRLAQALGKTSQQSLEALSQEVLTGIANVPDSLALHYTKGLCQRFLGQHEGAEKSFAEVLSGKLHLYPKDPVTTRMGRFNSFFWVEDARIRARCLKDVDPLVGEENIWLSYAWANRAEIAFDKGEFNTATDFATHSLKQFACNDAAQRVYLRAAFALAAHDKKWADLFLGAFDTACANDYIILHDCAAMAIQVLNKQKRHDEAKKVERRLERFLKRVQLKKNDTICYPETARAGEA